MKEEIDGNTIIVGDINTLLTTMYRSYRQKINRSTEILNDTIEQLDLLDIFRTLHPKNVPLLLQKIHSFQCTWDILKN